MKANQNRLMESVQRSDARSDFIIKAWVRQTQTKWVDRSPKKVVDIKLQELSDIAENHKKHGAARGATKGEIGLNVEAFVDFSTFSFHNCGRNLDTNTGNQVSLKTII